MATAPAPELGSAYDQSSVRASPPFDAQEPGDVAGDHQGLGAGRGLGQNKVDSHLKAGRARVAGILELEQAAVAVQPQVVMDIGTDRFPKIDAGFRAGDQHFDPASLRLGEGVHHRLGSVDPVGDRVFIGQSDGLLFHQQVLEPGGIQLTVLGQLHHVQVGGAPKNIQRFNSDGNQVSPPLVVIGILIPRFNWA
jgi:hypothetical protein